MAESPGSSRKLVIPKPPNLPNAANNPELGRIGDWMDGVYRNLQKGGVLDELAREIAEKAVGQQQAASKREAGALQPVQTASLDPVVEEMRAALNAAIAVMRGDPTG